MNFFFFNEVSHETSFDPKLKLHYLLNGLCLCDLVTFSPALKTPLQQHIH